MLPLLGAAPTPHYNKGNLSSNYERVSTKFLEICLLTRFLLGEKLKCYPFWWQPTPKSGATNSKGGGSMHWKVWGVNTVKTLKFKKRWGCMTSLLPPMVAPPCSSREDQSVRITVNNAKYRNTFHNYLRNGDRVY